MSEFFSSVSPDAWVQSVGTLLGALIGALLAGIISITVFNSRQKRVSKKELESQNSYLKHKIVPMLQKFSVEVNFMANFLNENQKIPATEFDELLNTLKKFADDLHDIDIRLLPEHIKPAFSNFLMLVDLSINEGNALVKSRLTRDFFFFEIIAKKTDEFLKEKFY